MKIHQIKKNDDKSSFLECSYLHKTVIHLNDKQRLVIDIKRVSIFSLKETSISEEN